MHKKKPCDYYPRLIAGYLEYALLYTLATCGIVLGYLLGDWLAKWSRKKRQQLVDIATTSLFYFRENTARKQHDQYWLGQLYGGKNYAFWRDLWTSREEFSQAGQRHSQHWKFTEEERALYVSGWETAWRGVAATADTRKKETHRCSSVNR
jgi:hypothetical protein